MKHCYLYADEASQTVLLNEQQKIILIGSDFGYGNFGDIIQHVNSVNIAKQAGFCTVSVMAANAIGFKSFPAWARGTYETDAIIFIADYPLVLDENAPHLKPVREIHNIAVIQLYGGGFLNEMWGDYVLSISEYFLKLSPSASYLFSGQQITAPYHLKVIEHIKEFKPTLFGVRDDLSGQLLCEAGFKPDFSFDDATEGLINLSTSLPLSRGEGLLMHLNISDYTGRFSNFDSFHQDLTQLSLYARKTSSLTLFQAFRDRRHEVNDSLESIKQLDVLFPFNDFRLINLAGLSLNKNEKTTLFAPIQGSMGFSCSYHVALWLQLTGIPCWLWSNNPFYDQKMKALQVTQSLEDFLKEPLLADHQTNLERRSQWRTFLHETLLRTPQVKNVVKPLSLAEGPAPWPFFYKGKPTIEDKLRNASNTIQIQNGQIEGLNGQLTELGHEIHTLYDRIEGLNSQLTELGHEIHKVGQQTINTKNTIVHRIARKLIPMRQRRWIRDLLAKTISKI